MDPKRKRLIPVNKKEQAYGFSSCVLALFLFVIQSSYTISAKLMIYRLWRMIYKACALMIYTPVVDDIQGLCLDDIHAFGVIVW